jgi:hypothetical protein
MDFGLSRKTTRRRSASVPAPEVKQRARAPLDEGQSVPEVSRGIGVAGTTPQWTCRKRRGHPVVSH